MTLCYQTVEGTDLDPDQEFFLQEEFEDLVMKECEGKTYCKLDVPNNLLRSGTYAKL